MRILSILSFALLAVASLLASAGAQTCGARYRKDWDMMSPTEKTTYKGALSAAMDSGAYIKFVEMHTEMRSEMEAHRQCMFIYWHRLFLVVFENMLRDQGATYACVTVPYFNWITANNRVTTGACTSFGNCLAITKELGGWTSGSQRTLAINGIGNSGICVNVAPLNRFCEASSVTGGACARCVPRSNWNSASVPASTGYASVRQQLFNGINIGQMSPLVEGGCHNNVHANLGSTMGTFASPADPIFWSHHAMVDLLHVIFHKCRVGTTRMTFAQKASNPVAWTSCARRNGGVFNPADVITMRTGERGVSPIDGRTDPKIGKYFTGVPNQFAGLMDVRDLGASSYGYYLSGQVATLYTQCDASPTTRALSEETERPGCAVTEDDGHKDVVIIQNATTDESEQRVANWYDETLATLGGQSHENMADLERQSCMFEDQCLGGTPDYTKEFQTTWNVTEPRCKTIVRAINDGSQPILYESWRENMEQHFGCPVPADDSLSSCSQDGSIQFGDVSDQEMSSWSSSEDSEDTEDTIDFGDVTGDVVATSDEGDSSQW